MNIQITPNPKCTVCKSYWKPTDNDILPSGLVSKSCTKCKNRQKEFRIKYKCEHNRQKSQCKECKGVSICEHNNIRSFCKECKGSQICKHNRIRSTCKECKGSSICEHKRIRLSCKECKGGSICEHDRIKSTCKECKGGSICEHDRIKSQCKECEGSAFCEHKKIRSTCKDCKGSSICEHNRIKTTCKECNFKLYLINLQRVNITRLFKNSTLIKKNHSIEYLGISSDEFIDFFEKKMNLYNDNDNNIIEMTWNNIHIDHIKPVSVFDLDDENEFLNCANYTNLQPLLAKDNLEKSNKWSITSEIFWNENIKDNENYIEIYNIS